MGAAKEMLMQINEEFNRDEYISRLIQDFAMGEETLSYTAISKFKRSPKCFIDYKVEPSEQTDAMKMGSVVHCLVLEPDKFNERYITDKKECERIGGAKPRATNEYKAWKYSQKFEIITEEVYQNSLMMANAVLNNTAAKIVLQECGKFETKVSFEYKGLGFVSFLDAFGNVIADLKICADAEPKKFQRDIFNMGYHLQAGIYTVAAEELLPYYIIAVDRNCDVSVHRLTEDLIEHGCKEFDKLIDEFKDCLAKNDFDKSFEYRATGLNQTHTVSKPAWI